MYRAFIAQLAEALRAGGIPVETEETGGYFGVMGFEFNAYTRGRASVGFLGRTYRQRKDGSFDIRRAVFDVMNALPQRISAKKERERRAVLAVLVSQLIGQSASGYGVNYVSKRLAVDVVPDGVRISFTTADMDVARAILTMVRSKQSTDEAALREDAFRGDTVSKFVLLDKLEEAGRDEDKAKLVEMLKELGLD